MSQYQYGIEVLVLNGIGIGIDGIGIDGIGIVTSPVLRCQYFSLVFKYIEQPIRVQ